jgi:hypothetical protein
MGLIHSRASKKRDKAEAKLLDAQAKQAKQEKQAAKHETKDAAKDQWEQILATIESGEASWDDLTRMQKMSMPISYQLRCKAAERRRAND